LDKLLSPKCKVNQTRVSSPKNTDSEHKFKNGTRELGGKRYSVGHKMLVYVLILNSGEK